jgi:hypothetical protein
MRHPSTELLDDRASDDGEYPSSRLPAFPPMVAKFRVFNRLHSPAFFQMCTSRTKQLSKRRSPFPFSQSEDNVNYSKIIICFEAF